jgi:hypothetical protein
VCVVVVALCVLLLVVCVVVVVSCVLLSCYVYLLYYMCFADFLLKMPDCWLEVNIRKVLRSATSTQLFLGFPVSISKRSDGSQHSKLPLHASNIALPT